MLNSILGSCLIKTLEDINYQKKGKDMKEKQIKKYKYELNGTNFEMSTDFDTDGKPSVELSFKGAEIFKEVVNGKTKGTMKTTTWEFTDNKLVIKGDFNKDGQESVYLSLDLAEGTDEIIQSFKKK
jgi:hypothetical protein